MKWVKEKILRKKQKDIMKKYSNGGDVLDVGSANSPYKEYFPNITSLDIDPKSGADIICDAENMETLKNESFDLVLCTAVLEHTKKPWRVIDEMKRVLKKGGTIILTVPFMYPLHETPRDYYRFTKYWLTDQFSDFRILELQANGGILKAFANLHQRIAFQTHFPFGSDLIFKPFFLVTAQILDRLDFLSEHIEQYGSIRKDVKEDQIMCGGYILVAKKDAKTN
ncbi:methyltransferase domain-containing protein [Candidatus Micrarchaeota archaeon]|nr:methyltransferase domain-containing protein [Candidatus Micrarchaeota archaeon]